MKVHKVRHYLDRRGTCFEIKIAYTLLNYRELAVLKPAKARTEDVPTKIAIASYRESPNVQVIATTAQTHLPQPGAYRYFARDQKYMRQSMLSLLGKIDFVAEKFHLDQEVLPPLRFHQRPHPLRSCSPRRDSK